MKATSEREEVVGFVPFKLTLSIETLEEAAALWNIFNHVDIVTAGNIRDEARVISQEIKSICPSAANHNWVEFFKALNPDNF